MEERLGGREKEEEKELRERFGGRREGEVGNHEMVCFSGRRRRKRKEDGRGGRGGRGGVKSLERGITERIRI